MITNVVNCCAWSIAEDKGNFWKAADDHQGKLVKKIPEYGCWIVSKNKSNTICVKNWTHVRNDKEKRALFKPNCASKTNKSTSRNCNLSWLIGWLVNYPSARGRLGYHGVWIREPPFLPQVKELLLLY